MPSWARNEIQIGGTSTQSLPNQPGAYGLHPLLLENLAGMGITQLFDVQVSTLCHPSMNFMNS
jgi:superfamily II DNA/RNA helicase